MTPSPSSSEVSPSDSTAPSIAPSLSVGPSVTPPTTPTYRTTYAVRSGDNVGEHTILFSTLGETMELVHKGHTRDAYARGALLAAKFLATKGAGRYSMMDVLGLS